MINFKPELVRLLKTILENVVETFPDEWSNLPIIIYEEEENTPHWTPSAGETHSLLRYRIEIYSIESTSELKNRINMVLTDRGFRRVFSADTHDLAGRRHTIIRFEGVYNQLNNKIYRR